MIPRCSSRLNVLLDVCTLKFSFVLLFATPIFSAVLLTSSSWILLGIKATARSYSSISQLLCLHRQEALFRLICCGSRSQLPHLHGLDFLYLQSKHRNDALFVLSFYFGGAHIIHARSSKLTLIRRHLSSRWLLKPIWCWYRFSDQDFIFCGVDRRLGTDFGYCSFIFLLTFLWFLSIFFSKNLYR